MQADALKFIAGQAQNAGPRVLTLPDPQGVYAVAFADGSLQFREPSRPWIEHKSADLETLCRVAVAEAERQRVQLDGGPERHVPAAAHGVQIWHSRDKVACVFDAEGKVRDACELELTPSPQMAMLQKWDQAGGVLLSQAEFVLLLRTTFAGAAGPDLVNIIRKVKATRGAEINQQIGQGKVSMSRSIVSEMTGAAEVPERVNFYVPIFAQSAIGETGFVPVEIDPKPDTEQFKLVVHPGKIEEAFADAERRIGERIVKLLGDKNTIPVHRGTWA